ncbi:MAG: hypothetical protein EBQ59_01380, partial [Verrucomicrobia bacterium]|nr:hypothetical protein [Verrucomicrobiota bacterium]
MRHPKIPLLLILAVLSAQLSAHISPIENKYRVPTETPLLAPSAKFVMTSTYLAASPGNAPLAAIPFQSFAKNVSVRWDEKYLYVEAKGLPDHPLMAGIKSWQQQVPIPQ